MTVGYWRTEVAAALTAAVSAIRAQPPAAPSDGYSALAARSKIYNGLARATALLTNGPPSEKWSVPQEGKTRRRPQPGLADFYDQLCAAAGTIRDAAPADAHPGVQLLQRAADGVGVIGDILAGHVPPGQRPCSREGAAIRAGAGVPAALADLADLTLALIAVDQHLPAWVGLTNESATAADGTPPLRDPTAALEAAARQMINGAEPAVNLVNDLDVLRHPIDPAPAADTADQAIIAVTAAEFWLRRHPEDITAAHLQIATRLGLTAAVHAGRAEQPWWRAAASGAAALRGIPACGPDQAVADELAEVLRWLRPADDSARSQPDSPQVARLAPHLLSLAGALANGLPAAVTRGNLLVNEKTLQRPHQSLIYVITQLWRPATRTDTPITDLAADLTHLNRLRSPAPTAFPGPPRPRREAAPRDPAPSKTYPARRQPRSR
ncbi:hypothetical protein [Actinoplanes sp. L3-i22]|uniref:hypothetical protein n=1 Tax=Actinoplanes sp. L3-i22 TaxID=2836373 RepID=UPI001C796679|nr:hypothetical protein [Actinoplanes sp. L3-i22]BCY11011.1 hypothetical protein L3i22_060990 [Actinoplanes sp. L3-i22]